MGDPYWYEWSVGLLYALDMLNPDCEIKSVILQAQDLQGLDDVVVNFCNGETTCIQIKHTRENNSLTFSDLIRRKEGKGSYLNQFYNDWKKGVSKGYKDCAAVLFTNRKSGVRKSKIKISDSETYERPPLEKFWPKIKAEIKAASRIEDIKVDKKWQRAWKEWLDELYSDDDEEQKLDFLKRFEIKANQEDLEEIINSISQKISKYFRIDGNLSIQLHQRLCYALMKWTTTMRDIEEITKEDLLQALSLSADSFQGIHEIATSQPFFSSRIEFMKGLEKSLMDRTWPIQFLSGEPGSGKTNLVSYMTNKIDSVVTLRFYAFKPITSEDTYLSADKGISSPRALWGDLLIQLRHLLKGKLAKYEVPISNEILKTTEKLRSEVLRLSNALAEELGRTTVIAIDGIDHAARAGSRNTFLETLIPPEGVPNKVCFLIVGQPIHEYTSYPDWLFEDEVNRITMPRLNENDIRQLTESVEVNLPKELEDPAIKLIHEKTRGNTLSSIYAVHEIKNCISIEEIEECMNRKRLSSGINSYYEYVWKSALENIPEQFFYVDDVLAGILSLINKRITPKTISKICREANISEHAWKRILQKLYPVVVEENGCFSVFHNDIRVYLEKYLRKNNSNFASVSSSIADFFMNENEDPIIRHELVFSLLKYANREESYVDIFTKTYVIEALNIGRPMEEIIDQLELTLLSIRNLDNYEKVIDFSCAVSTLYQFLQSSQWIDRQYQPVIDLPLVLYSEKKIVNKTFLTLEELERMLKDVSLLRDFEEEERADYVLEKWLGNLTPVQLLEILLENNEFILDDGMLNDKIRHLLKKWGKLCRYTGIKFNIENLSYNSEYEGHAVATFHSGWLKEGELYKSDEGVEETLSFRGSYYKNDFESFVLSLFDDNENKVLHLTREDHEYSNTFRLRLAVWAILKNKQEIYEDLIKEIIEKKFEFLNDLSNQYYRDSFPFYNYLSFVLSYGGETPKDIIDLCISACDTGMIKNNKRAYYAACSLLSSTIYLGSIYRDIYKGSFKRESDEYEKVIATLFDESNLLGRYEINGYEIEKFLLQYFVDVDKVLNKTYNDRLNELIVKRAKNFNSIRHIEVYWSYLKEKNELQILEELFDYWMSENGLAWRKESSDMFQIAEDFINKALEIGWLEKVKSAQRILKNKSIGYVGRKEYSLFPLLDWYESIDMWTRNSWETISLKLLNVSKNASQLGDNRAAIYIDSAVASIGGKEGFQTLWEFANFNKEWDISWLRTILDGVISSLEANNFSIQELVSIWKTTLKIYSNSYIRELDNDLRKIYIADLREALLLAADRLGYTEDFIKMLKEIAPLESKLSRIAESEHSFVIPTRWFEEPLSIDTKNFREHIEKLTCEEALNYLEGEHGSKSIRWNYAAELIRKVREENPDEIEDYSNLIFELLMRREPNYNWEFDGAYLAFKSIFPYLNSEKIKATIQYIVESYQNLKGRSMENKLFYIKSDLEHFTQFYYMTLSVEKNMEALDKLLEMHIIWLTGNGNIPMKTFYEKEKDLEFPDGWVEFFGNLEKKKDFFI